MQLKLRPTIKGLITAAVMIAVFLGIYYSGKDADARLQYLVYILYALGIEDEPNVVARLLDLAANVRREDAPAPGSSPYKGLNYFDEADADLFVGREVLTAKLLERLLSLTSNHQSTEGRFLAIVGASGSGKSSLVRAGLVPALRWNKASTDWLVQILTPTNPFPPHPVDE